MTESLLEILNHRAQYQSERQAFIFLQDGEAESRSLTYGELDRHARAIAAHLESWQGERILLLYPSGLEFITAFFGCLYAGLVAVPVPRHNQNLSRLLAIAHDAQAEIALTTTSIREDLDQIRKEQTELAQLKLIATDTLVANSQEFVPRSVKPESLAFLQYTSGSTGTPKGVMISHGNIIHNQRLMQHACNHSEETIIVGWLPLFHDLGLIGNVLQPIYLGFQCILMPPVAFLQKPVRWLQAISHYRATTSGGPNFAYDLCINKIQSEELDELDLSSWDLAFNGAEPIRAETLKNFSHKFAACGFRSNAFYPCYGMAEYTLGATGGDKHQPPVIQRFSTGELERNSVVKSEILSEESRVLVGCGRPAMDTTAIIVDPESLTRCETGQIGEIWLSGGSVAAGYWNRPEATQETFQAYLQNTGEGPFLRTGDLGFLDNEELFITGRLKDVILIRGRNHYPQDIEHTVEKSHPALQENSSAAFAVEAGGDGGLVVACEVKQAYLRKLNLGEIVEEIKIAILTEHELDLHGVVLLKTGSIPKTSSGKIRRSVCKTGFLESSLNNVVGEWRENLQKMIEKSPYVAPRTTSEEIIAHLFAEVLGIETVGIHDSFFELGGHSLLATQLISRLRQRFEGEISLRTVLESPTVAQLDQKIGQLRVNEPRKAFDIDLPTIVPTPENRYQPFPLTDIQQAYWLGRNQNFDLGNIATHIYIEVDCDLLNLPQLNQAWQKLVEHHDMLRAVVLESGQQQVLEQVPTYEIEVLDLQPSSPATIKQHLEIIRQQMSHEVLPAEQWPLFKIRATQLNQEQTRLHLSFDALTVDAWSIILLIQQWQQLYHNPQTLLSPLEITFQDYIKTEQSLKETLQYKQSQEYWFNRNLPPAPKLPFAVNLSSIIKPEFKRHVSQLSASQWQQLKQRATAANLTPSAVLLSAFADVLNYWSQSPRFTINLTLFNRLPLHIQVNQLVGDFTSLTLLEVDCSVADTFMNRAKKLQQQLWQDLEHRAVSGVEVQRELRRRHGNIQPMGVVFTSTLGLNSLTENTSLNAINAVGKLVYCISQTPQVWLDHQIFEEEEALVFNWDVVAEIFPVGLVEEMFTAYCSWLEQLASSEEAWHRTQSQFLPSNQLAQQSEINHTTAPICQETLHSLFQKQVAINSQSLAVISPEENLTYQELSEIATKLGSQLQQLGATPNRLIAIVMEKGWEQIVAVLGILMSGAAYLPIDPELPPERQSYLLVEGQVELVLTQPKLRKNLSLPVGVNCLVVEKGDLKATQLNTIESVQNPTDLAYVIYTSGSTGLPKGVMIDHRGAVNTILDINQRFQVGCQDRVLALSALNFDLSVYDIFGLLAAGGAIVIPESELSHRNDPAHWRELINAYQVTIWNTVPALMQILVASLEGQTEKQVGNVRLALLSGDWLPVKLPSQIQSLWPEVEVISLGGATEASIWSIIYPITQVESNWKSIPYGKPMMNQHFYVLNQFMETRPTWVIGELYIGGTGLALGYWQDEEKTNHSFVNHPVTQERLYRTGDLGRYLPSGDIEFLGREDCQVKINGYRIELGEIEGALKQHSGVEEAVVNLHNNSLVAYVIPSSEPGSDIFEILNISPHEVRQRWKSLVDLGNQQSQKNIRGDLKNLEFQNFEEFWQNMQFVYINSICLAFRKLGIYCQPGERYNLEQIISRCQIVPRYRKWLYRALRILVAQGWLQEQGEIFESLMGLPETENDFSSVKAELSKNLNLDESEIDWVVYTAQHLDELVTERVHSAQIYALDNTPQVYQKVFSSCHEIAKEVIKTIVQFTAPDKQLRVLEVGAGYGSITSHILPLLPTQTNYTFTDISHFFLQKAQDIFAIYPFVNYDLLDLNVDPIVQGYTPHSFDVIIAASVLHDTYYLEKTMKHLRSLLVPGGLILFLEETKFYPVFDLSMGLQQGFDVFEDESLRSEHPLLSREQWQTLLSNCEFESSLILNQPESISDLLGFDILIAQGSPTVKIFQPDCLSQYLTKKLPKYMLPSTYILLENLPLTPNGKVNRKALPAATTDKSNLETAYVAPRNVIEEQLVQIWAEVIGVSQVGIYDHFFELGGDSLQATRVITRIRETFQVKFPMKEFFEEPRVINVAEYLELALQLLKTSEDLGTNKERVSI